MRGRRGRRGIEEEEKMKERRGKGEEREKMSGRRGIEEEKRMKERRGKGAGRVDEEAVEENRRMELKEDSGKIGELMVKRRKGMRRAGEREGK